MNTSRKFLFFASVVLLVSCLSPLIGGVGQAIIPALVPAAYKVGNGTKFQIAGAGSPANNDCAKFDANGNIVTAGATCGTSSGSVTNTGTLTSGAVIAGNGGVDITASSWTVANGRIRAFGYAFDGGGSALTAGPTGYQTIPYSCTIAAWNISVDAGTATVDIWKKATGTAIPTVADTITASATPAISTGTSIHSTTLTSWTTSVAANDIIGINLKTVATASFVSLTVQCDQ